MNSIKKIIALLLAFVLLASFVQAETNETIFYNKVEKAFQNYKTIGASFVVYHNFQKIVDVHYGYANKRLAQKVTSNTKFKVASITKMVVAMGLMQLVEKQALSLDDDIGTLLGYPVYNPYFPKNPITLRTLLNHTSSIQDTKRFDANSASLFQLIGPQRLNDEAFAKFKPGEKFLYSNFGFGIVGAIIEKITGQPLETYMKTNLFNPLGIDAAFHPQGLNDSNLALRYQDGNEAERIDDSSSTTKFTQVDSEYNYNISVGKLCISANDLSKLLLVLSGNGFYNGISLLSPQSVALMREVQTQGKELTPYGIGVEKKNTIVENVDLYGHQGLYYSAYCDAYFDSDNLLTMVLLTNGVKVTRIDGTNALARQLFRLVYKYLVQAPTIPYLVEE